MVKHERRIALTPELRVDRSTEGKPKIIGHAAVFNRMSEDLGWFREKVAPGAFSAGLAGADVRALFNHDPNIVLGRTRAKTLTVQEDAVGLLVEITPPDTQGARDVLAMIERGDVSQMSFGFITQRDEWDKTTDPPTRTLLQVELFDVSPVTFPAYPDTDVAVRSLEAWKKQNQRSRPRLDAAGRKLAELKKYLTIA